jgi:DNA polymerase-3 subunit epsilon
MGHTFPEQPTVCTMRLAGGGSLACCCEDYGIDHSENQHSALHDARAAARLMQVLLLDEPPTAAKYRRLPPIKWPGIAKLSSITLTRAQSRDRQKEPPTYVQKLLTRSGGDAVIASDDPAELAYAALLDRVLEDRRIDESEGESLVELATRWGLHGQQIMSIHRQYVQRLAAAAVADGIVTDAERRDLNLVCCLLGVTAAELDNLVKTASNTLAKGATRSTVVGTSQDREALNGKRVCFTGECQCRVSGELISREMAENLAASAGLTVAQSVTKRLDLLVVADPQTQSGKAKKAQQYGIRILHEPVFWQMLGVDVE